LGNAVGSGVQAVEHEGHDMRGHVLLGEIEVPLHLEQVVDKVVPLQVFGTPQAKSFADQRSIELIVGAGKYLGAQAPGKIWKESTDGTGNGQSHILGGHLLVLSDNGKWIFAESASLDAQNTVEERFAGESQAKL